MNHYRIKKIRPYDADGACELLNSHNEELTLDELIEFRKHSALEEAEEAKEFNLSPRRRP
jgi:hypothetical protein